MSSPFIGECRAVGFNFGPQGWSTCQGQILPISQYDALFNLIGTTFGGDGQQTFALPDLRGRPPFHQGSGFVMGQMAGVETVTLNINQIPSHNHMLLANGGVGNSNSVQGNAISATASQVYVNPGVPDTSFNFTVIGAIGNNQPHDNLQPYMTINWIISLSGIYPSQG